MGGEKGERESDVEMQETFAESIPVRVVAVTITMNFKNDGIARGKADGRKRGEGAHIER